MLALVMIVSCTYALAGCSKAEKASYDIVMITDGETISDGGLNQNAWSGVESFAKDNKMTCRYYQPSLDDNDELQNTTIADYIKLAVEDGAKFIILPSEKFAVAAYENASIYKDVNFVLVDALPTSVEGIPAPQQNVMSIDFDELQGGFLAGYCAVIDGNTKLGYYGSFNSDKSNSYGSGFAQGAAYAADQMGVPTSLEYAEADNPFRSYYYSFNIEPVYKEIPKDDGNKYFTIKVENGIGTGTYKEGENVTVTANPAPEGKKFDHWELKSNTKGVKDKKVNISSKKDSTINLIVEKCDATITAVYSDAETVPVVVLEADGVSVHETINAQKNSSIKVSAPAAKPGYVFSHWDVADEDSIEDKESKELNINVADKEIKLTPVYEFAKNPTFDVTVKNGTGSGAYVAGDYVEIIADAPEDGMMFDHWKNADALGESTGIEMENEYCYITNFEMIDRYAAVPEKMYDLGAQVIFNPSEQFAESVFTAGKNFDYTTYTYGAGVDHSSWDDCWACIVTDYGKAINLALQNYKGGSILKADCSNECIYISGKSIAETYTDGEGNEQKDENYNKDYALVYKALVDGKIRPVISSKGVDVRKTVTSKCLTLNYWVAPGAFDDGTTKDTKDKK